jgi:pyridine nucleotide-disulfide oxidoreductase family protein
MSIRRLVLAGAGHAHVHVLAALAREPIPNLDIVLISPYPRQVYSGMLPGWIAGHYTLEECVIAIEPLAAKANIQFVQAAVVGLDANARQLTLSNGDRLGYDWLSINSGPLANTQLIRGASKASGGKHEIVVPVRPIENFIKDWGRVQRALGLGGQRIMFIGAGAAGCELAMATAHYALEMSNTHGVQPSTVMLASAEATVVSGMPASVSAGVQKRLQALGVAVYRSARAEQIKADSVQLSDGHTVMVDFVVVCNGSAAAAWPANAGLAVDDNGFISTNAHLQSVSHPNIFAVGDCATMRDFDRPRSGVFAVRAGPPLLKNLRLALESKPLRVYRPQSRWLYLISCGGHYAIGSWGSMVWQGELTWHWKNKIDRAFVSRYSVGNLAAQTEQQTSQHNANQSTQSQSRAPS